ncbi:MAG: hypothetical protein CO090_02770 [Acidobacteria bacterium CG_4_9_14_3_um_filter_49_7]|nr:MAG: hypothetical protein CO090_02770 [Acidobacteria bacterium CG_4_9_14_3_um_filter_49_7]
MKRVAAAIVSVYVVLEAMDFLIHNVLLSKAYAASAQLWRPQAEMKMGLMFLVTFIFVVCFVMVFTRFFKEKNVKTGTLYGLIFGIGTGVSMGYGTYAAMPLPYYIALSWFLSSVVEMTVAGAILGLIAKD